MAAANTSVSTKYWAAVAPNDGVNLPSGESNYLYIGSTGNLTCICNGVSVLFSNLAVGYHPIRTTRVMATGTTATLILAAN